MLDSKSRIIENAQGFAAQGKVAKAIAEWKRLLSETPQDGNIYNTIADLHLRACEGANAIDACLKAAEIYKEAGFELKGVAVLKKILKIDPERIDIYERLADINVERGLTGSAMSDYQQTAKLYLQRGNLKAAIYVYRKLASFSPEDPEIPLSIARLYQKQEQNREAILAYEQAEVIYESKKMVSEARQVVEEIVKIDPNYLKHIATKEVAVAALDQSVVSKGTTPSQVPQGPFAMELKAQGEYTEVWPRNFGGREHEAYQKIEPLAVEGSGHVPLAIPPSPESLGQYRVIPQESMPDEFFSQALQSPPVVREPTKIILQKERPVPLSLPVERVPAVQVEKRLFEKKESPNISEVIFQAHLAEVDVYLRYGLSQNAIEKLLVASELAPMREEPYLRLREVYLKEGQNEKAEQVVLALAGIYEQKDELEKRDILLRNLRGEEKRNTPVRSEQPIVMRSPIEDQRVDFVAKASAFPFAPMPSHQNTLETADLLERELRTYQVISEPRPEARRDEEYIDLASVMAEDLGLLNEVPLVAPQQEKGMATDTVEGVINQTKRQEYVKTCYHLGLAHKEAGNYEKAIRELEQALSVSGSDRFHEVLLLLASCYSERGYVSQSIEVLQGGMNDLRCDADSRLFIQYELAFYFEQLGDREKSFSLYKEIYRIDPHFKDVAGKVKEIPYRKPTSDSTRANERFIAQEELDSRAEDTEKHGLYLGARPKEKRRISYI